MKRYWLVHLTALAALAFAVPAFGQSMTGTSTSGSSGTGLGSSSTTGTLGLSSGTGSSSTGSGFGISGSSSGSGNSQLGLGNNTSNTGVNGRSTTGTGSAAFNSNAGLYNSGRTGSGQTFFPGPTSSNPFAAHYVNPLGLGNANTSNKSTFGQPIYATVTSTTSGATGARGQGAGAANSSAATASAPPRFSIALDVGAPALPEVRRLGATRLQADVQGIVANSSMFSNNKNIQIGMDQGTLVLRGKVASDRERRMAEGLVRLSPGVDSVRNELQVAP